MEIGGIDLIFYAPRQLDVRQTILNHVVAMWPEMVVEEGENNEIFIEKTQQTADREDYYGDNTSIYCIWDDAGQTVANYLQRITIVVNTLDDEMFDTIAKIQRDFLAGYRPSDETDNRTKRC